MRNAWHRYKATAFTGLVFIALVIAIAAGLREWAAIVSLAGVALSAIYFAQSQRLEETRLFKDLFSEFNIRYDKLNDVLQSARLSPPEKDLTVDATKAFVDYFNLCAEEYMFYTLGYIRKDAWLAWLEGMRYYYDDARISKLWDAELEQDSYYGFTKELLRRGTTSKSIIDEAELPPPRDPRSKDR